METAASGYKNENDVMDVGVASRQLISAADKDGYFSG